MPALPLSYCPSLIRSVRLGVTAALFVLTACGAQTEDMDSRSTPPANTAPLAPSAGAPPVPTPPSSAETPVASAPPAQTHQNAQNAAVERLTVLGERPPATYGETLNFVRSRATPAKSGQLARWEDPVCPVTLGLPAEIGARVTQQIDMRAEMAHAPVAKQADCQPNVEVIFTNEPQKVLDMVAKLKGGAYLGFHSASRIDKLKAVIHPVEALYLTATRDAFGEEQYDVDLNEVDRARPSDFDQSIRPSFCAGSKLALCTSSVLGNVLIVVDGRAVTGEKLTAIADYIAMLALAQIKLSDDCDALSSILDLLSSKCADQIRASAWSDGDLAYVKSLYSIDPKAIIGLQRAAIAGGMQRASEQH